MPSPERVGNFRKCWEMSVHVGERWEMSDKFYTSHEVTCVNTSFVLSILSVHNSILIATSSKFKE